ncbi:MAG: WD40-repeat-containing domain protein [Benjaminiella poitrasii]|nr:MAG: WD40-repeat-containing domain protein [Benjaminiella poitrasii]
MTLVAPSLISPTATKLLSYLSFSSINKPDDDDSSSSSSSHKSSDVTPTYITIVMRKDGTPTTKRLDPTQQHQLISSGRIRPRRPSFSSATLHYQPQPISPPKQRRLMFSSFISRFHHKTLSRKHSKNSIHDIQCNQTEPNTKDNCYQPQDNFLDSHYENDILSNTRLSVSKTQRQTNVKRLLEQLPTELTIKIVMFLDCTSVLKLGQTCKQFHRLCHGGHQHLWQTLFYRDHRVAQKATIARGPLPAYYDLYKNHRQLKYRWRQGRVETRYLTGHEDSVYCLIWLDHERIISGSRDRSIKIWDLQRGEMMTRTEHDGSVLCLRVSSDLTFLVSGSSDSTCLIWSLPQLEPCQRLEGHLGGVLDVAIVKDVYIVSSSRDATIRVWDRRSGVELRRLMGHAGPVNALGSYGSLVVSASGDTTLKLWDVETGHCLRTFVGHTRGLACVKFDGQFIYSGGQDNKLKVWNAHSGHCLSTLDGHSDLIRTIDSFENMVVSGSYDKTLRVWDVAENKCLLSFQSGHSSWIFNCLLNRSKIISAGQDKRIMVLDFGYDLITID